MIGWFTIQYEVITLSTNTVELVIKIDVRTCRSVQSCHCLIARKVVAVYICMTSLYVQQRKGIYRNKRILLLTSDALGVEKITRRL